MPYKRRPLIRRRKKRQQWYNRKYSTLDIAKKAWYATKYLKGLINSEKMYVDRTMSLASQSEIYNLQLLSQGDGAGNRTGNSILVRSIYLRGYMQINPSVSVVTRVSLCLVQDTQQIADTVPTILDIFTSISPEATIKVGNTTNSAGRFKILWRKNYSLIQGQVPNINLDKFFKLYSHVKFNGTGVNDIQKNGYYLVVMSSEVTNFPTVSITSRMGYYDN